MKKIIENIWDKRELLNNSESQDAIKFAIKNLDEGKIRIAEKIKKNIGVEVTVQEESPQPQETKSVEINENIKSKDKEVKKDKDLKAKTTEKKVDPKKLKK